MMAFTEFPDQWESFKAERPETAADEIVRWATPVTSFQRTAVEDTELSGVQIKKGQRVVMFYRSANFDEDVFDDPFRFDIGRDPNKHLAFGYGVHFCLGAALARMEVNSFFTELLPRLKSIELAGDPQFVATTFVGGIKHLPVRDSVT
jgi:cytochrome P450